MDLMLKKQNQLNIVLFFLSDYRVQYAINQFINEISRSAFHLVWL